MLCTCFFKVLRGRIRGLTNNKKGWYTKGMENEPVDLPKASDELEKQEEPMKPKDYYTVSDIAEMVGLSRQRIHQIIDTGRLKPDIITRFEFIFKRKTLDKFVKNFQRRAW